MSDNIPGIFRNNYSGSGNKEITDTIDLRSIVIKNDGGGDISLEVELLTGDKKIIAVRDGEGFEEMFPPFRKVKITTIAEYRIYTRAVTV